MWACCPRWPARGGRFYSGGAGSLNDIYSDLAALVADEQIAVDRSGMVRTSETVSDTVFVDASSGNLTVGLTWPGSDLDLSLVAPDGTVIDHETAAQDPSIRLIEGPTYEFLKVAAPMLGNWQVRVHAIDVNPQGEPFHLVGRVGSRVRAGAAAEAIDVDYGRAANLRVAVEDGAPILGADVWATVFAPTTVQYDASDVPRTVSDNAAVMSTLVVSEVMTIQDVNVRLDIAHTYCSELDVFLVAPDGTRVELFTDVGGSSDNFTATVIDDEADTAITAAARLHRPLPTGDAAESTRRKNRGRGLDTRGPRRRLG